MYLIANTQYRVTHNIEFTATDLNTNQSQYQHLTMNMQIDQVTLTLRPNQTPIFGYTRLLNPFKVLHSIPSKQEHRQYEFMGPFLTLIHINKTKDLQVPNSLKYLTCCKHVNLITKHLTIRKALKRMSNFHL